MTKKKEKTSKSRPKTPTTAQLVEECYRLLRKMIVMKDYRKCKNLFVAMDMLDDLDMAVSLAATKKTKDSAAQIKEFKTKFNKYLFFRINKGFSEFEGLEEPIE